MSAVAKADYERISANGLSPCKNTTATIEDPAEDEIDACLLWMKAFASPTKTLRPRSFSYSLKHVVESWTRGEPRVVGKWSGDGRCENLDPWGRKWLGDYMYISNGAFIEAARRAGYRVKRASPGSPNAIFNMKLVK